MWHKIINDLESMPETEYKELEMSGRQSQVPAWFDWHQSAVTGQWMKSIKTQIFQNLSLPGGTTKIYKLIADE